MKYDKLGRNLYKMALNCTILKILLAKTIYIQWRILKIEFGVTKAYMSILKWF